MLFDKTATFYSIHSIRGEIMTEKEYAELYQAEYSKVVRLMARLLGSNYNKDAEDCAQDTFIELYKRKDSIDNPMAYLYKSAQNNAIKLKELAFKEDLIGDWHEVERRYKEVGGIYYKKGRNEA
jgi:DNA-directed RNA polymerase specialized sigma24 family protein